MWVDSMLKELAMKPPVPCFVRQFEWVTTELGGKAGRFEALDKPDAPLILPIRGSLIAKAKPILFFRRMEILLPRY